MDDRKNDSGEPRSGKDAGQKILRIESVRRRSLLRDPYKLGVLVQLCLIILLVSLLIYCLFPFFAAAQRLGLPAKYIFALPAAVAAVVFFFVRRAIGLIRTLRRGPVRGDPP